MSDESSLASQVRWWAVAWVLAAVPAATAQGGKQIAGLIPTLTVVSVAPSSGEILARLESENNRRHVLLKEYSGSRQYTLQNERFGKQAAVAVLMSYRQVEGERYTVLTRSGSDRLLIVGKVWVDAGSYAVVRIEGQFAASLSILIGAPRISEEFVEVRGFWLPGHVRSVTSSFLLGPTELDILFSNYQLDQDSASLR